MPKFIVDVTRGGITQNARVIVECDKIEDAAELACEAAFADAHEYRWTDNDNQWPRDEYYYNGDEEDIETIPDDALPLWNVVLSYRQDSRVTYQCRAQDREAIESDVDEGAIPDDATYNPVDGQYDIIEITAAQP